MFNCLLIVEFSWDVSIVTVKYKCKIDDTFQIIFKILFIFILQEYFVIQNIWSNSEMVCLGLFFLARKPRN